MTPYFPKLAAIIGSIFLATTAFAAPETSISAWRFTDAGNGNALHEGGWLTTDKGFVTVAESTASFATYGLSADLLSKINGKVLVSVVWWDDVTGIYHGGLDLSNFRVVSTGGAYYEIGFVAKEAKPVNMSVRMVADGKKPLILGFVIAGGGPRRVLLRAVGAGLIPYDVKGYMPDPRLDLFDATGKVIMSNDNWLVGLTAATKEAGAFPLAPKDAEILAILGPGAYTVQITAADGVGGDVLCEMYQLPDQQ